MVSMDGVTGMKFTDLATGNTLFLPTAGHIRFNNGSYSGTGVDGYYWSSTAHDTDYSYSMYFSVAPGLYTLYRRCGLSIRAVAE